MKRLGAVVALAVLMTAGPDLSSAQGKTVANIAAIMLTIKVDNKPSQFILLASDGTINRMDGDGHLVIDNTQVKYLDTLKLSVDPSWLTDSRSYEARLKKGKIMERSIFFSFKDGSESGITYKYGSESQQPPKSIMDFFEKALNITDPWYSKWKSK